MASFSALVNALPPPGKRVLCRVAPGNEIVRSLDVSIDKTIRGSMTGIKIIDALKESEKQKGQSLGTTSQEEKETAAVVSSAVRARDMNVMLNEIPFYADDEFNVVLSQSISVTVPSGSSLVDALFLSPVMNLGGSLSNLARQFAVMRVNAVMLQVSRQNRVYSTVVLAYSPTLSRDDITEMTTDLDRFYRTPDYVAIGARVQYFTASARQDATPVEIGGQQVSRLDFDAFTTTQNRIKRLPISSDVAALPNSTLGVAQPGFLPCPMASTVPRNPVYRAGMDYVSLDFARDFISDDGAHMALADANMYMPVYGKFYYTLSNTYADPVDQILTIRYDMTCKHRVDGSTYRAPSALPLL